MAAERSAEAIGAGCGQPCALVALGSNLAHPWRQLVRAAAELAILGDVAAHSSLWLSEPVGGPAGQPHFLNGVIALMPRPGLETPRRLLAALHRVEARHGRVRRVPNAARTLDLDLLTFDRVVVPGGRPTLPHPRMMERAFVLAPLLEVAPEWRHPVSGQRASAALARLGRGDIVRTTLRW